MITLTSKKRSYMIWLTEKTAQKVMNECAQMSDSELQEYIDGCLNKANKLSDSAKGGAWTESKHWRDKAKIAIIEKELRYE